MLAQALSWHESYHYMDGFWNKHDRIGIASPFPWSTCGQQMLCYSKIHDLRKNNSCGYGSLVISFCPSTRYHSLSAYDWFLMLIKLFHIHTYESFESMEFYVFPLSTSNYGLFLEALIRSPSFVLVGCKAIFSLFLPLFPRPITWCVDGPRKQRETKTNSI